MQITNSPQPLTAATATSASAATQEHKGAEFTVAAPPQSKAEIFADYDLSNISPREIDELADRLRENGSYEFGEMMMLETRGERFTQHLNNSLYQAGILDNPDFDATARFDYLTSAAEQIEMSRRHGDPTKLAQENLDALLKIHQRTEEIRNAQVAPAMAGTALTRSLFAFQTKSL